MMIPTISIIARGSRAGPLTRLSCRQLSTSQRNRFKFKLTDEMSEEFDKQQELKQKSQPEQSKALHTLENSLIMARVSHDRYKNVIKCGVPKHRFNEFLAMYRRENDDVQAIDDNDITHPGDWVLLRRDDSILDKSVTHRVDKVIYAYGNYVDPLTNRTSLGIYYEDDWEQLEKIKVDL